MSEVPEIHELSVPPDAEESGGHEVLRAFVVGGALSISLQRAFENPGTWGMIFVDLARHVAHVFAQESDISEEEALNQIRRVFEAEWERSTQLSRTEFLN